jgi:hypothetical protein
MLFRPAIAAIATGFLLAAGALAASAAEARPVQVFNNSDFAMIQLQAKPSRTPAWTQNLIGKYSLGVGKTASATVPGAGCAYDFLATYDDGHKTQRLGVDVCRAATIEFN